MSRPDRPPDSGAVVLPFVFVDRSLGRLRVPQSLRGVGVELVTLAEHYGMPADQDVEDVEWITESAAHGWVCFLKDAAVRRRPAERRAILASGARCFCLANANITAEESARRYIQNLGRIAEACSESGPFLFAIHERRIERLVLDPDQHPA